MTRLLRVREQVHLQITISVYSFGPETSLTNVDGTCQQCILTCLIWLSTGPKLYSSALVAVDVVLKLATCGLGL